MLSRSVRHAASRFRCFSTGFQNFIQTPKPRSNPTRLFSRPISTSSNMNEIPSLASEVQSKLLSDEGMFAVGSVMGLAGTALFLTSSNSDLFPSDSNHGKVHDDDHGNHAEPADNVDHVDQSHVNDDEANETGSTPSIRGQIENQNLNENENENQDGDGDGDGDANLVGDAGNADGSTASHASEPLQVVESASEKHVDGNQQPSVASSDLSPESPNLTDLMTALPLPKEFSDSTLPSEQRTTVDDGKENGKETFVQEETLPAEESGHVSEPNLVVGMDASKLGDKPKEKVGSEDQVPMEQECESEAEEANSKQESQTPGSGMVPVEKVNISDEAINPELKEKAVEEPAVEEVVAEEVQECGFCKFMKAGPCGNEFSEWEKCTETAEKEEKDIVLECFEKTEVMKNCMEGHREYYAAVLEAGEEAKAAGEGVELGKESVTYC